ncbi:MAG: autotransporter domain-containing protein [Alphaproteobacteria bacterium]
MSTKRFPVVMVVTLLLAVMATHAGAQSIWQAGPGDWFEAGNWSGGVPGSSDTAIISNGGTARVGDPGAEADSLFVGEDGTGTLTVEDGGEVNAPFVSLGEEADGDGTLTVDGAGSSLFADYMAVGASGTGTVLISNGGLVDSFESGVAEFDGSTGSVTVTGPGSTWATHIIVVGSEGQGTLTVEDGGAVEVHDGFMLGFCECGSGTAIVRGAGSSLITDFYLSIGGGGTGTLTVEDGATVESPLVTIAEDHDSTGTVTVTGAGSRLTTDFLSVGGEGTATFTIADGGVVDSFEGILGEFAGSTGTMTVTGPGSTWMGHVFVVGLEGSGTLTVEDGATIDLHDGMIIGECDCSDGTVVVRGAGSSLIAALGIFVGADGTGTLTVADGGLVRIDDSHGTLDLAEFATASGTLNIGEGAAAGTLDIAEIHGGDGLAILNFNHNEAPYTFVNSENNPIIITGGTAVNHVGTGTTILDGVHSYTGATTISSGTLRIDGTIVSPVTVGAAGTLGGTGSILNDVLVDGRLAPGASIGTLTVTGNLTFGAGSTYAVEVDADGLADRTDVTGTATLTDGTVRVIPLPGSYATQTDYVILTATDPIATTFAGVTSNSAFLDGQLIYGANGVTLRLVRNATLLADIAGSGSSSGVAGILDTIGNNATGDLATLLDTLLTLPADQARAALEQLSGTTTTAPGVVQVGDHAQFSRTLASNAAHAGDRSGGSTASLALAAGSLGGSDLPQLGRLFASLGPVLAQAPRGQKGAVRPWVSGYGIVGEVSGDGTAQGFVHRTGGLMAGVDWEHTEETTLGVAFGLSQTTIDNANSADTSEIRTWRGSLYGTHRPEGPDHPFVLDGALGAGMMQQRTTRRIAFAGIDRSAYGDTLGYEVWADVGASRPFDVGRLQVTPRAMIGVMHAHSDAYTETGADAANLSMSGRTADSVHSRLSIAAQHPFETDGGSTWTPLVRLGWWHEHARSGQPVQAALAGAPQSRFEVNGLSSDKDRLELGAGLVTTWSGGTRISADYETNLSRSEVTHGVLLRLQQPF